MFKTKIKLCLGLFVFCAMLAQSEEPKLQIKKAVKINMIGAHTVLDKFKLAKEVGFDGIEANGPVSNREEIKKASEATGLPIHGVVCSTHWGKPLSAAEQTQRDEGRAGLEGAMRDAHFYGADTVLLVPGVAKGKTSYEECWERSIAEIRKVLPLAEELNLTIALENVWNDFLTDPKENVRYIEEINSPRVKVYFDVGNAVRYSPPAEWISTLGNHIIKLDVKGYAHPENGQKLGSGFKAKIAHDDADWPSVCAELKKIGYTGWATAEVGGGGKERLTEIYNNMEKAFSY